MLHEIFKESNKRSEGEIRAFHIKVSMLQEDLCKFESVCEIKQVSV